MVDVQRIKKWKNIQCNNFPHLRVPTYPLRIFFQKIQIIPVSILQKIKDVLLIRSDLPKESKFKGKHSNKKYLNDFIRFYSKVVLPNYTRIQCWVLIIHKALQLFEKNKES